MNHWIDEAEKRQQENDITYVQGSQVGNEVTLSNHEKISGFLTNLNTLITRVSKISPEERKPSIEIGSTHLENDNRYEFYGSAFQTHQKKIAFLFNKTKRYMYWRRIYINITDTPNLVKITLYEKATSDTNQDDVLKKKLKFMVIIDTLQPSICFPIIDWLVYKLSSHDLKKHFQVIK
jgi:hypothetical protein